MKTTIYISLVALLISSPLFAAETLESVPGAAKTLDYWRQNILFSNVSHAAGGFGLALVLPNSLTGRPGMRLTGWLLIGFLLIAHGMAFTA